VIPLKAPHPQRAPQWRERISRQVMRASKLQPPAVEGTLTRMVGLALEATGCQAAVGDICDLLAADGSRVEAEVVGFAGERLLLMPTSDVQGLAPSARVIPRRRAGTVKVGPGMLGRIIDGTGTPLDGLGPITGDDSARRRASPSIHCRDARSSSRSTWACARSTRC
jgi:flagellum-specific ATP synthase